MDFLDMIFGKKNDTATEQTEVPLTDEMIAEMERSVKKDKNGQYKFFLP